MAKTLDDVVVLDLTSAFWSSLGAALLGDFGARVIRIEPLSDNGSAAHRTNDGSTAQGTNGKTAGWDHDAELCQRNKLSVAVSLDEEEGRRILAELVAKADVLVTDWPIERLGEHGLDYATLASRQPGLIYTRGSGFGPKGPDRDLPAIDELAAARTGMMPILPQPDRPPVYAGSGQMYSTVMLALGTVLALRHRQESGEGQQVDVSLFAGNMYGASLDVQAFLAMGGERFLHPLPRTDAGNPMSGVLYQAKDGRWVTLTMPDTDRWWPGLAQVVGLDADDPRFDSHEKRCEENRLELIRVLEERFREHPSTHWKRLLDEYQLSADVIEEFDFPANDPQTHLNRYILELDRPGVGRVKSLGFPIYMSGTPARLDRTAPCLGQHSAEVLHDTLGYSEDRITELARKGIIS